MDLEKLEEKRKSVHVADQIVNAAESGDLEPGDKLPSEKKMAEEIGVSRSSIREALAALRLVGIVKTKAGDGSYFTGLKEKEQIRKGLFHILSKYRRPLQLQEARRAFECGIVSLAAEKFDERDKKEMKQNIQNMKSAVADEDYEKFIDFHKRFHLLIASSTENEIIKLTEARFEDFMEEKIWKNLEKEYYLPRKLKYLKESLNIHERIYKALSEKDPQTATRRMREHFKRY